MILNATSTFRLARKDFGITGGDKYNAWFNAARMATMADSVDVVIEAEGWWADAESQRSPGLIAAVQRVKTAGIAAQIDRVKTNLAGKPDSTLMDYFAGPDLLVCELLEEDSAKGVELARGLLSIFQGTWAYAVYGHALAVTGDTAGAARQYAEAKRVFKPRTRDPNEKFPQDDEQWFYLDQLVRTSLERGHIVAATSLARVVAELYPGIARASATYGWALSQAGDKQGAAEQFAKALRIDSLDTRTMELRRR
jgi:tetratricopeptide (TPR) repeat protein